MSGRLGSGAFQPFRSSTTVPAQPHPDPFLKQFRVVESLGFEWRPDPRLNLWITRVGAMGEGDEAARVFFKVNNRTVFELPLVYASLKWPNLYSFDKEAAIPMSNGDDLILTLFGAPSALVVLSGRSLYY